MSGNVVIGIDGKKKRLAAVVTHPEGFKTYTRTMPAKMEQCVTVAHNWSMALVSGLVRQHPDCQVLVFVEAPFFHGNNRRGAMVLAQINGALIAGAMNGHADYVSNVENQVARKVVIGNGRPTFGAILRHLGRYWPKLATEIDVDDDLADSAILNMYGHKQVKKLKSDLWVGRRLKW